MAERQTCRKDRRRLRRWMGVRGLNVSEVQKNEAAEGQHPHPHGSVKQQALNGTMLKFTLQTVAPSARRFLIEDEVREDC